MLSMFLRPDRPYVLLQAEVDGTDTSVQDKFYVTEVRAIEYPDLSSLLVQRLRVYKSVVAVADEYLGDRRQGRNWAIRLLKTPRKLWRAYWTAASSENGRWLGETTCLTRRRPCCMAFLVSEVGQTGQVALHLVLAFKISHALQIL